MITTKTKMTTVQGFMQFSNREKYAGIAENKELHALAKRITQVVDQVDYLKTSDTMTPGAVTIAVYRLFEKQSKDIQALSTKTLDVMEGKVVLANSKLFSNTNEVGIQEAPLTPEILKAFNDPKADVGKLTNNPNSARHLAALSKLGLVPEGIKNSINKIHSPESWTDLQSAQGDLDTLSKMEKEYKSFVNMNDDAETAERLISMGETQE